MQTNSPNQDPSRLLQQRGPSEDPKSPPHTQPEDPPDLSSLHFEATSSVTEGTSATTAPPDSLPSLGESSHQCGRYWAVGHRALGRNGSIMFLSAKLLLEEFPATVEVALIGELLLRWDTSESSSAQSIVKGLEAFFSREYMTELAASVDAYVLQRVLQLMSPPSKSAATTFADFLSIVGAPEVSRAVALRHAATVLTTLPLEAFSLKRENMLSKYPTLVPLLLEKADKHKKARSE